MIVKVDVEDGRTNLGGKIMENAPGMRIIFIPFHVFQEIFAFQNHATPLFNPSPHLEICKQSQPSPFSPKSSNFLTLVLSDYYVRSHIQLDV